MEAAQEALYDIFVHLFDPQKILALEAWMREHGASVLRGEAGQFHIELPSGTTQVKQLGATQRKTTYHVVQ